MTTVGIDSRTGKPFVDDYTGEPITCMEDHTGDCKGEITYRASLTGTGTPMIRCDHHQDKRLEREEVNNRDYPDSPNPPSWFHGSWGGMNEDGEYWDED